MVIKKNVLEILHMLKTRIKVLKLCMFSKISMNNYL